jgi:hypothetical protein
MTMRNLITPERVRKSLNTGAPTTSIAFSEHLSVQINPEIQPLIEALEAVAESPFDSYVKEKAIAVLAKFNGSESDD